MLHEKVGKHGTWNKGRYQVAQSWLNRLHLKPTKHTAMLSKISTSPKNRKDLSQMGYTVTVRVEIHVKISQSHENYTSDVTAIFKVIFDQPMCIKECILCGKLCATL